MWHGLVLLGGGDTLAIHPALAFLETSLAGLRQERYDGTVYIITGTGHHSTSGRARVGPAVQRWLDEAGLAMRDASTDGRGGMIAVVLRPH